MRTTDTRSPGTSRRQWFALGILGTELSDGTDGRPMVAEAVLPEGASPALHVHHDLDDSFYLLEGTMVLRCGADVWIGGPGDWVQFPMGVPHTFRVMDGPARVLIVHTSDRFGKLIDVLGRPAEAADAPTTADGPTSEELAAVMEEHGITTLGGCLEEDEARALMARLGPRQTAGAART